MSVNEYYELSLQLLDKTIGAPTTYPTTGRIINGNLLPFKARVELVNTGNSKTDNGVLTLRIPPDGTFIRTEPILTNEEAKDRFIIQAQIRQSDGAGGIRYGKIFRFTVGAPTIQDDVDSGETLKLSLIPTEYRLKEHLTSKQLLFFTPKKAFEKRLTDYNITKGANEPAVLISVNNPDPADDSIQLPNDEPLRQSWEPATPTKTHDLLWEIINRLSQPAVGGGTFQDYYFDIEGSSVPAFGGNLTNGDTKIVNVKAGKFGDEDSGIILDPLSVLSPVDAEKDKTVMTDLVKFKNNIIAEGNQNSGTLPMDRARFNSSWQHAQNRPEFSGGANYYNDDVVFGTSLIKRTDTSPFSGKEYVRFFEYIGLNNQPADDPISIGQADWYEDFTVIPAYSTKAQYDEFEIVTQTSLGQVTFYELLPCHITSISGTGTVTVTVDPAHGLSLGRRVSIRGTNNFDINDVRITPTGANTFTYSATGHATPESPALYDAWALGTSVHVKGDASPSASYPKWQNAFNDIAENQYEPFYSYTPWTSDYDLQLANLSGAPSIPVWSSGISYCNGNEVQYGGKVYTSGLLLCNNLGNQPDISPLQWFEASSTVPSWIGAVPDMNFERANFDRVKSDDQFEQVSMKAVVRLEKNSANITSAEKINGARFLITDGLGGIGAGDFLGKTNKVAEWYQPPFIDTGEWKFSNAPKRNDVVTDLELAHVWKYSGSSWSTIWQPTSTFGAMTSPFHCVSNGNAVSGGDESIMGFGLIGGATQIPAQAIRLTFHWDQVTGSRLNLSSRGAWWVQHLPMPRREVGTGIGTTYSNSTLDTRNLDLDRNGNQGWNNGLDSEDLGIISSLTMKVRLSIWDSELSLCNGFANMPMKAWAIDIFGRIWFSQFTLERNGQYDHVRVAFGESAPANLYHNRIDELFSIWGIDFSYNWWLKEKEFSGIAFDWRFVKSWGIMWNISYDDNNMYTGVRDHFLDTISSWAKQTSNNTLSYYSRGGIPPESFIVDHVTLDIDELAFEKQLFANSDDVKNHDARTELVNVSHESDYLNLKGRAKGEKARKQFVNQQWHMLAHGDVRMRLGKKFKVTGSRVPEQAINYNAWLGVTYNKGDKVSLNGYAYQSLRDNNSGNSPDVSPQWWINLNESVCADVKHIIDNDGYTMQVLGVRKFVI